MYHWDENLESEELTDRELAVMEEYVRCVMQSSRAGMAAYQRTALAVLQLRLNQLRVELLMQTGETLAGNNPEKPN
ncbi:MAG: hypothetical protein QOJ99_2522 [Bryobacterales bacterium]|jgi:hypothetical protein|nr:hypothetical protein [Bryobacterales bacterium]